MEVVLLFAALFVVAALVFAVLARKKGPIPSTARSTEPGNVDPRWDQTRDGPAGPGAEPESVVEPGDAAPASPPERRQG